VVQAQGVQQCQDDTCNLGAEPALPPGRPALLHIPKTGGTSIEEAALAHGIAWACNSKFIGADGDFRIVAKTAVCSKCHLLPSMLTAEEAREYSGASVFCVSRDPYDRMLSEYRWRVNDLFVPQTNLDLDDGLRLGEPCSEAGLNLWAQRALQLYAEGNIGIDDCHLIPQAEYIWDEAGNQFCKNVLRLEDDFQHSFNSLMARYDYPVRLTKANSSNVMRNCPGLKKDSWWPETKQVLQRHFADDFAKLGYSP